jgi:hypothetical protein
MAVSKYLTSISGRFDEVRPISMLFDRSIEAARKVVQGVTTT